MRNIMNKKTYISIAAIIVLLIAGILFWQSCRQNTGHSTTEMNNSAILSSSGRDAEQKVQNNLVEIFYLPHPPAEAIVKKVEDILKKYPEYKIKKYNFYDANNKVKIESYKLLDHIPVAIFINGTDSFTIDGQKITLKNFPKGDAFVPTLEGSWSYEDLEKILANSDQNRND